MIAGDPACLASALATHQAALESKTRHLADIISKVRSLRAGIKDGHKPSAKDLVDVTQPASDVCVACDLPWPWGGEPFELNAIRPLTYIIGPLGSGKTRLARLLADVLPHAVFVDMDRRIDGVEQKLTKDAALQKRVDHALSWLVQEGAVVSDALIALLVFLETDGPTVLIVDMVEHGLCHETQTALIAFLRNRFISGARTLLMTTRSSAILDLGSVGPYEDILFCPPNHSPPLRVAACPGTPGYEAVATCLATPEVRARTAGMMAWFPQHAQAVP